MRVHARMHACRYRDAHLCVCMGRPEANIRCLPVPLSTSFFETKSLTELGMCHLGQTSCPASPGIHLPLFLQAPGL